MGNLFTMELLYHWATSATSALGREGFEPSRLAAQGPKPCVYAISPPALYAYILYLQE